MYNDTQYGGQAFLKEIGKPIMDYAKASGSFTKEQAYLMVPQKHFSTIDKALNTMRRNRNIFMKGDRYYVVNPKAEPDYNMIRCLWVLLDMKGDELPNSKNFWISRASNPAYLSYVKNQILYDIVPVNKGEAATIAYIDAQYINEKENYSEAAHKYIIVVPREDVLETLPQMSAPHIYAVVHDMPYDDMDYEMKKVCDIDYYEES